MYYLSREEIVRIHDDIIEKTGGFEGILDENALSMLEKQPFQSVFGQVLYPNIYLQAALYLRTIIGQVFNDGSKRTGMTVVQIFLNANGYSFALESEDVENFAIYIATEHPTLGEIASWIEKHSKVKDI